MDEPAELRIPAQGVDVEQHGAASVGDVRAVHAPVAAPCQALGETQIKTRPCCDSRKSGLRRVEGGALTQMIHESTVPNMACFFCTALATLATLSSSHRSLTALK